MHRPLAPRSVDGIKRRCTPGMGRCQGSFCGPRVQAIIARELGIAEEQVPLDRAGMNITLGRTKQQKGADAE
jgi:glycerol-3-phosphate dehydrogenase